MIRRWTSCYSMKASVLDQQKLVSAFVRLPQHHSPCRYILHGIHQEGLRLPADQAPTCGSADRSMTKFLLSLVGCFYMDKSWTSLQDTHLQLQRGKHGWSQHHIQSISQALELQLIMLQQTWNILLLTHICFGKFFRVYVKRENIVCYIRRQFEVFYFLLCRFVRIAFNLGVSNNNWLSIIFQGESTAELFISNLYFTLSSLRSCQSSRKANSEAKNKRLHGSRLRSALAIFTYHVCICKGVWLW